MINELRESPAGSIARRFPDNRPDTPARVWRVIYGVAPNERYGQWLTDQEVALWRVADWRPAPARVETGVQRHTCSDTLDVATGFGTLRCDLPQPHPGALHHDPTHPIIWAPCSCCGGAS